MKQAVANNDIGILHRIDAIEKEITNLKLSVLKKFTPTRGKTISLKGVLKDVNITDEDISSVKKTLYAKTRIK